MSESFETGKTKPGWATSEAHLTSTVVALAGTLGYSADDPWVQVAALLVAAVAQAVYTWSRTRVKEPLIEDRS